MSKVQIAKATGNRINCGGLMYHEVNCPACAMPQILSDGVSECIGCGVGISYSAFGTPAISPEDNAG